MERRLSAIVAADVVGYSRLIRADEEGTLLALRRLREELIDPTIKRQRGRIVKLMGDGMLVEFASVVDAVSCAADLQQALAEETPRDPKIEFRIGINLGDVVIEGDDIHGDGVNLAARLEALCEPGGLCISDAVHEQVRDRLSLTFEDSGKQEVKNIDRPVQVWKWHPSAGPMREPTAPHQPATAEADRPSIAVLPFENMSGDPEQEYFADGVVEELIMALSRLPWLFVIARNSSFTYKGKAVDIKQVGRDLGVRYVLEGSLRKAGGRVRISGQLVNTANGTTIWADRYDGSLEDIFDLQDKITASVVGAIAPKLERAEIERSKLKPTSSLDAYDYYLRGMADFHLWTVEGNERALQNYYKAIDLDPDYASALAMAARCINQRLVTKPIDVDPDDVAEAERLARRAADLGPNDAMTLAMAGVTLGFAVKDVQSGAAFTSRAVTLNPNLAWAWYGNGWMTLWLGKPEIAIENIKRAVQLSPQDPMIIQMHSALAHAYFTAGDDAEAWDWAQKALLDRPGHFPALLAAAASSAQLSRMDVAEDYTANLLKAVPGMTTAFVGTLLPYQVPKDAERWAEALGKAGMPHN